MISFRSIFTFKTISTIIPRAPHASNFYSFERLSAVTCNLSRRQHISSEKCIFLMKSFSRFASVNSIKWLMSGHLSPPEAKSIILSFHPRLIILGHLTLVTTWQLIDLDRGDGINKANVTVGNSIILAIVFTCNFFTYLEEVLTTHRWIRELQLINICLM